MGWAGVGFGAGKWLRVGVLIERLMVDLLGVLVGREVGWLVV